MKNALTPEQLEERKKTNMKILKFGCLPILVIFGIIIIISIAYEPESSKSNNLIEKLTDCTDRASFNATIVEMQEFIGTTTDDSIKTALNNLIERKEVLWREIRINNQFSAWDGSHIKLKKAVKDNMNDPSSFEHIETKRWVYPNNNSMVVYMKYRGKNAFGAMVVNEIKVKADLDGNILEVIN